MLTRHVVHSRWSPHPQQTTLRCRARPPRLHRPRWFLHPSRHQVRQAPSHRSLPHRCLRSLHLRHGFLPACPIDASFKCSFISGGNRPSDERKEDVGYTTLTWKDQSNYDTKKIRLRLLSMFPTLLVIFMANERSYDQWPLATPLDSTTSPFSN